MSSRHPHQRQCKSCGDYIDLNAYQCPSCGAVLKKLREHKLDEEEREFVHKKKLEAMHVPNWLRNIIDIVNFCQAEPRIHQLVRLLGGAIGLAIAYSALYWANYAAGNYFPIGAAWVLMPLGIPCLIAFWLGHHFFFSAFYVILEAVATVVETEKKDLVRRGVQQDRIKAKHAAKHAAPVEAPPRPEHKLPHGIKPFDAEKDEEQRVLDAITRALE